MFVKLIVILGVLSTQTWVRAQSSLEATIGTENEYDSLREVLPEGVELDAQSVDTLVNALSNDRMEQRSQTLVARRLAETNDPQIIRRLINVTSQNSEINGDNRIIKGLTYSSDPQVRQFMFNIITNTQPGIDDRTFTSSSPEGYAASYLSELAERGDTEVIELFKENITSDFIQENLITIDIMSEAIAQRGTDEDLQFLQAYVMNSELEYPRAVIEAISESPSPASTETLISLIENTSGDSRNYAFQYLGERIENNQIPAASMPQALRLLRSEFQTADAEAKDVIIGALLKGPNPEADLNLYTQYIRSSSSEYVDEIAEIINHHAPEGSEAYNTLINYIETHPESHLDIVRAIADSPQARNTVRLLESITTQNDDPEISYYATKALLQFNDPRHMSIIKNSLRFSRNYRKEEIIAYIVEHGEPSDYLVLFDLLADDNREVRLAAFDAISAMMRDVLSPAQYEQLIACLNDPSYERSETMLLIAALTDITLSYAARTEANIGVSAYNNSRGVRTIAAVDEEQILVLKNIFQNMIN